jgi:hypothetical protein
MSLKNTIMSELQASPDWLTVTQFIDRIRIALPTHALPIHYATVARALRKLRAEGKAVARWAPNSQAHHACREWAFVRTPQSPVSAPVASIGDIMQKPTLVAAIEAVINEFVAAQRVFSAHDVTNEVRKRAATVDPVECGTVHVDGKDTPRVVHEEVRDFIHDLYGNGKINGYERNHNGSYWVYNPSKPTVASSATDSASYDGTSSL